MRKQVLAFLAMLSLASPATPALAQHVIKASPKLWVETTKPSSGSRPALNRGQAGTGINYNVRNQYPGRDARGIQGESTAQNRAAKSHKPNARASTARRERSNKASIILF